tara:strand:+ start:317 stop:1024 length:708 start_codon:yes stop_codon:yes gene_type:complete
MKKFLIKLVIESDTKLGRRFDVFIQILIVLSLISFSVETIPDLDLSVLVFLEEFELFTVIVFSVELLLRLILTKPPFKYIISFFGIVDILAVLPFYLSTGVDLRSIRIFRLFRLFRIFKLLKYNSAIDRLLFAFREIKKELFIFLIATIFLLYVSSVGIYYFENAAQPDQFKSVFHSMWWAVATLTTVGYGDVYPITVGGKIFTTFIVFIGMGLVAVPTGLLASALSKTIGEDKK